MESNNLIFSGKKFKTSTIYLIVNEPRFVPTGEFVLLSISMSTMDGLSRETVKMDVRLAVKLAVTIKITKNHGASTIRDKLLLRGSPVH